MLDAHSSAAVSECASGRAGGTCLHHINVDTEAAVGPSPGTIPQAEKVFGGLVLIHSTASFSSPMPKATLCSHARRAPAHTAIFFFKVHMLESAASSISFTRILTTSMGVPWGTVGTHQAHSGAAHGFHDMGQDWARTGRNGAGGWAGRWAAGWQHQLQPVCADKKKAATHEHALSLSSQQHAKHAKTI